MLAVDADVSAVCGRTRIRLTGNGRTLTARISGSDVRLLIRWLPAARPALTLLGSRLVASGLTLDVVVGRARLLRVGTGVRSNALARNLGLPNVRIGP